MVISEVQGKSGTMCLRYFRSQIFFKVWEVKRRLTWCPKNLIQLPKHAPMYDGLTLKLSMKNFFKKISNPQFCPSLKTVHITLVQFGKGSRFVMFMYYHLRCQEKWVSFMIWDANWRSAKIAAWRTAPLPLKKKVFSFKF